MQLYPPCRVLFLVTGVAGLLVLLEEDVTLEGVVERGGSVVLLPVIDSPRPLLAAGLEVPALDVLTF